MASSSSAHLVPTVGAIPDFAHMASALQHQSPPGGWHVGVHDGRYSLAVAGRLRYNCRDTRSDERRSRYAEARLHRTVAPFSSPSEVNRTGATGRMTSRPAELPARLAAGRIRRRTPGHGSQPSHNNAVRLPHAAGLGADHGSSSARVRRHERFDAVSGWTRPTPGRVDRPMNRPFPSRLTPCKSQSRPTTPWSLCHVPAPRPHP